MKRLFLAPLLVTACGGAASAAPPRAAHTTSASPEDARVTRGLLEDLVRVDTSHGNETAALEPVARRLRAAGVSFEIVESSPGRGNLVARVRGTGKKKPLLVMAHVDVVPVEGQKWSTPPFTPTEKDGFLYGRGINDDKSMAASAVLVLLELAKAPKRPSRDVIVALTAGEETGGAAGIKHLLTQRRDLIDAEIALDECGSMILAKDGARVVAAGMSLAEKTYQSFKLVVQGTGGHASMPAADGGPVPRLARALVKVGEVSFKPHALPAVTDVLALGAETAPEPIASALGRVAKSAPTISPEDAAIIARDRLYGAFTRTTCVATMLSGSPQDNVLPTSAEATLNCRVLPDETPDAVEAALVAAIGDAEVKVQRIGDPQPRASMEERDSVAFTAFKAAVSRTLPDAIPYASMCPGTTDSRWLRAAGIHSYGISASPSLPEDLRAGRVAHGPDERRMVRWLGTGTALLREVVSELVRD